MKGFGKRAVVLVGSLALLSVWSCGGSKVSVRTQPEPAYRPSAQKSGPPPHAPAHGFRKKHSYWYYPSSYVYYDAGRSLYFYMENGNWQVGARLPSSIQLTIGEAVSIELDTDQPYLSFEAHKASYPPGYKKKFKGMGEGKSKEKSQGQGKGKKK